MIIEDDENSQGQFLFFDKDRLRELAIIYKFPLALSVLGIILLITAIILLIKNQTVSSDVIFSTSASSSAQAKFRIDIAGAVLSPGIYEVQEGERIADALIAAGGLSADADREWVAKNLNRAAKLVDGGKIYIPSVSETLAGKSQNPKLNSGQTNLSNLGNEQKQSNILGVTSGQVNLNTVSQSELEALPGIGPVTAGKILAGRPYQSVEDLQTRKIIGNSLYNKLKDLLTVY